MYPCWIHKCVDDVFLLNIAICNGMASNYQVFFCLLDVVSTCGFIRIFSGSNQVWCWFSRIEADEFRKLHVLG